MDRYNKYQKKQYTHAHTSTLHTQQMVASTWPGDHQERPSAPTNNLHKLHMARYRVHQLQLQLLVHTAATQALIQYVFYMTLPWHVLT